MTDTQQPAAWWLVDDEDFVITGPYETDAAADEGNQDLYGGRLAARYGRRGVDGFLEASDRPEQGLLDSAAMTKVEAAELAIAVEATLTKAGLTLITDDTPVTPNGWMASGVGVRPEEVDGAHVVMLMWGSSDDADHRTVDIMLTAVADVLRVHGYAVERHPAGLARLVTGRTE
jgi:hypothetical protein